MAEPRFTVEFHVVGLAYMHKLSPSDQDGGGSFTSYATVIKDRAGNFRRSLHGIDYIEQLGSNNTRRQDSAIREHARRRNSLVVEPGVPVRDFPVPDNTRFVLEALLAKAAAEASDG